MKRRDILKGISLLPLSGGLFAKGQPGGLKNLPGDIPHWLADDTNIFRTLGVEPLINCRGTFTIIGGSLERPSVRAAMEAASKSFVQYDELADGIGKKLGELTKSPWGMVSRSWMSGTGRGDRCLQLPCISQICHSTWQS